MSGEFRIEYNNDAFMIGVELYLLLHVQAARKECTISVYQV